MIMTSYVIHVSSKNKKLVYPLQGNYEIGLLDINYKYKNYNKKTSIDVRAYNYNIYYNDLNPNGVTIFTEIPEVVKPFFDLMCYEIEPSVISGYVLRNILIHTSIVGSYYSEFRNVDFHKLISKNITNLSFNWPNNIEIINFTVAIQPHES